MQFPYVNPGMYLANSLHSVYYTYLYKEEKIMHDLDRTQAEFEPEESFEGEFDPEEGLQGEDFEFDSGEVGDQESPFSEGEEMELASQLLEISDEAELDQFLGGVFRKIGRGIKRVASPLGGMLKGVIKKALPIAGGALGSMVAPGIGTAIGSKLASSAGSMFGLELEGLSQEDQEFEVARRVVRLAGSAAQNAAAASPSVPPVNAAKTAVIEAAKRHAPGLISKMQRPYGSSGAGGRRPRSSGRWLRRGNKIILYGIYA